MKRCPICRTEYPGLQAQFCPADGSVLETVRETVDPFIGTTIEGKYRIEAMLGAGGMGAVYRARHLLLGRDVAVKVLRAEMLADARAAERFHREAQAAARIEHPNAVTIYDFGISADGNAYLVMELLRGTSLRDVLDRDRVMPLGRTIEVFSQVCAGIDRAHQLGIVHRDIKPDNVMVDERPDGTTGVKVVDFGIAMLQDLAAAGGSRLTGTGMVVGTANYMSPEHCRGAEMDSRSDIYSLGVVLFEMLTGRVPFQGAVPSAVIVAHVNDPPPPPSLLRPDLSRAVERVVLDALAKRPADRPQTAAELARRLAGAISSDVAVQQPTTPVPRVTASPTILVTSAGTGGGASVTSVAPPNNVPPNHTPPTTPAYGHGGGQLPAPRRGMSPALVAAVAFVMLAIGAAIAVAAVGIVRWRSAPGNSNVPAASPPTTNTPVAGPTSPPVTNAPVGTPPNIPPIAPPLSDAPSPGGRPITQDEERDVTAFLSDWVASSQARDIEWQLRHYADVVDYYKAGPVPRFRVRADRERAYVKFDRIQLRITRVTEATALDDGRIRLVFDKEWNFANAETTSTGKVRELLELRRFGGELKIVKEQDLSVY